MSILANIPTFITEASTTIKVVLALVTLLTTFSAAYVTGQTIAAIPTKMAKHDSVTAAGFRTLDKMLCIQVADHRKLDWKLCYINPAEIMPVDNSPK